MGILEIVLIAVGLAMDAFAVSIAAAATEHVSDRRAVFRLSFHFGLFQFLMPVLGWAAGMTVVSVIAPFDHWVAFGLLAFVGGRMVWAGTKAEAESFKLDPSRGLMLISLSVATSIDALAVGLSLAVLKVGIWHPSVVIGQITAGLSLVGIWLGRRLSERFGKRISIAGGIVLIIIGLRILSNHLCAEL